VRYEIYLIWAAKYKLKENALTKTIHN